MTIFPCAKINLGLNIVSKRLDGYHNLETVFYPIPLHDALEVYAIDNEFPTPFNCDLKVTGMSFNEDEQENLVVKAYKLLAMIFNYHAFTFIFTKKYLLKRVWEEALAMQLSC